MRVAREAQKELRRRAYAGGVLPKLKSVATTTEMRAVFDSTYELGSDVGQYHPRLVDSVPVVTIRMKLANCDQEIVFSQASEEELAFLVDALRGAQNELEVVKEKGRLL